MVCRLSSGESWIRTLGPRVRASIFETAAEPGDDEPAGSQSWILNDRQGQVYHAPSQAGSGNDINAGSPGFQKAPTRGLPAWSRNAFSAPSTN